MVSEYTEKTIFSSKAEMYEECRLTVCELPGILNVRFSFDAKSEITEVHILSDMSRSPKQILRDVQSLMFARYNLILDRRIVSIAQINSETKKREARNIRLICDRVDLSVTKESCAATVVLADGDDDYSGSASSTNSFFGKRRIIAEATLTAVKKYVKDDAAFSIADVKRIDMGDRAVDVVLVASNTEGRCDILVGAACDPTDESLSVAKATLDAVNRKVQLI